MFRKFTNDSENRQLDCTKNNLSIELTNELLENQLSISDDDLQLFIQLYFDQKRTNGLKKKKD